MSSWRGAWRCRRAECWEREQGRCDEWRRSGRRNRLETCVEGTFGDRRGAGRLEAEVLREADGTTCTSRLLAFLQVDVHTARLQVSQRIPTSCVKTQPRCPYEPDPGSRGSFRALPNVMPCTRLALFVNHLRACGRTRSATSFRRPENIVSMAPPIHAPHTCREWLVAAPFLHDSADSWLAGFVPDTDGALRFRTIPVLGR